MSLKTYIGRLVGHNPATSSPICGRLGGTDWSVSNGQLCLKWGNAAIATDHPVKPHQDGPQLQLYWPYGYIKWRTIQPPWSRRDGPVYEREVYISAKTCVRWVRHGDDYWGLGAQVLGFGLGFDYQAAPVVS